MNNQNSQNSNSPDATDTCLVACPIFRQELEYLLTELNLAPRISYMHYAIHNNPSKMDDQLQKSIEKSTDTCKKIRFLVGRHCDSEKGIDGVVKECGGQVPEAKNCIDMLIGHELAEKLQENRTSLMTPAWIRMITQSIQDGNWSITDARINLGWYDKILILDTGVEPLSDEQIMAFYDLIQVEIGILPVNLEHFKTVLQNLLQ
ncbi:MAG TPA: DUF1638 domain-containing protein [Desulfobacterales bacterium]|nr:DUF1638 domain-containing protein [Desulfobacterales bacterium]